MCSLVLFYMVSCSYFNTQDIVHMNVMLHVVCVWPKILVINLFYAILSVFVHILTHVITSR